MKPSPEQVREWAEKAGARFDPHWGVSYNTGTATFERFAELAAAWGAEQAQQATVEEPELPEAVAQFNWNAGSFEWLTQYSYDKHHKKPLFTAAQMHDHFQAGVRVGMAQSQDARRYQLLRDSGFAYANVDLETDLDGDNFVRYQIRFDIPEPAHSKFEDDEWSASDIDAAIDSAMQKGQK